MSSTSNATATPAIWTFKLQLTIQLIVAHMPKTVEQIKKALAKDGFFVSLMEANLGHRLTESVWNSFYSDWLRFKNR